MAVLSFTPASPAPAPSRSGSHVLPFRGAHTCTLCGQGHTAHRNAEGIWTGCQSLPMAEVRARLRETLAKCAGVRVVRPFAVDAQETV